MKKFFIFSAIIILSLNSYSQVSYYKGEWTKINNQSNFSGTLKLEIMDTIVTADILWTYIAIDSTDKASMEYYQNKKGRMGIEYIKGKYSPITHDFIFEGISKTDPDLIIGLDKYILKLSLNKQVIYGETYSNGDKDGLAFFIRNNDPNLIKEMEEMKNKLIRRTQDSVFK